MRTPWQVLRDRRAVQLERARETARRDLRELFDATVERMLELLGLLDSASVEVFDDLADEVDALVRRRNEVHGLVGELIDAPIRYQPLFGQDDELIDSYTDYVGATLEQLEQVIDPPLIAGHTLVTGDEE